jgi:DNA-binding transcriptional LysR family regulator
VSNPDDISLRHLRILSLMLQERSLTRAAEVLDTSQSSISKILAKLRLHFGDPLFVRVGLSMQPTPTAMQLEAPLRSLLAASDQLRVSHLPFDPSSSDREFCLIVTDAGMLHFLPPLMSLLENQRSRLRLRAIPLELGQFEAKLESGTADIALGSFPQATRNMRHQRLYSVHYLSVARKDHPRLKHLRALPAFLDERHIVITASSGGHAAHQVVQQALEALLPADRIQLRLPSFMAGAVVAARTDAITTIPEKLAVFISDRLGLATFNPPVALPKVEIAQFWHERYHRDPAHRWLRATIRSLFAEAREAK